MIAAMLRGDQVTEEIQLAIEYAPDPPFPSGTPETAPPEVVSAFYAQYMEMSKSPGR
jgi:cyclohexyl-isocyanide hydratase